MSDDTTAGADAGGAGGTGLAGVLSRLPRPRTVLYVHFDRASGTWSLDGHGPLTRSEAIEILGHAYVTVKPVIDLEQNLTYTGYVAPPRLKERTALLNAGRCTFPHCTRSARLAEYDHQRDYRTADPPTHATATDCANTTTDERPSWQRGWFYGDRHHKTGPAARPNRAPSHGRCYLVTAGTTTSLDLNTFRYAA